MSQNQNYQLGPYRFDAAGGVLILGTHRQQLEPQVSALLLMFCQHAGQLLSRDVLLSELWPGRVVSDDALRATVKKLRDALGDDAKTPAFIKTQPMKGYTLIAETSVAPTASPQGTMTNRPWPRYLAPTAALIVLAVVMAWLLVPSTEPLPAWTLSHLTQMNGSEVSPDYDPVHQRLVFAHRANQDDYLQLYSKDLRSGRLKRLTFDEANYINARWSSDGSLLMFTRTTPTSNEHFIARYDSENGIEDSQALTDSQLDDKYLLDWSADNRQVYLVDAPLAGKPRGIWQYHWENRQLSSVTTPQHGQGDYFAKESPDGKQLAILRHLAENKRELIVMHLATGSLLHTRILPEKMDRLAWGPDQQSLALSNFRGEMLSFHFADDTFSSVTLPHARRQYLNHLFFQCGEDCFYLRAHNGNFLELAEQPNPFAPAKFQATDHFEQSGAEDFPQYGRQTGAIYYVHTEQQQSHLAHIHPENGKQILLSIPKEQTVSSLSVNPQETHLIGLMEGRVFQFGLGDKAMRFLSAEIDTVYPPVWETSGEAFLFGKQERNGPVIYRAMLNTPETASVINNYVMLTPLSENRMLLVDETSQLWLQRADGSIKALGTLPDITPNRWREKDDWLYVTFHLENRAYMRRIHLYYGRTEQVMLAKNRFRLNFDMNDDGSRILVVRSKLADSDLVKVTLNQP